jgi:1,4-dihydroxy-2-naphthoate octaprenyltransferase
MSSSEFSEAMSPLGAWMLATRPRTLPAAVSPVMVGTAMAVADGKFEFMPAFAALLGALLLQIGVNLANDYFDFKKGIDTLERLGPVRVTQSGLISPDRVRLAMIVIFSGAFAVGIYLTAVAGWPVLAGGMACILASLAYSGGPFPLASHGLGDLFVFIFFGLVAVCGTYYVQALQVTTQVLWLSVPVGFLITAIIVVNNLRDIPTDRKSGKNTLAVILGERGTKLEYLLLVTGAYIMPAAFFFSGGFSVWVLLPMISIPLSIPNIIAVHKDKGPSLNPVLAKTAALSLVFSLLLAAGLVISI